MFRNFVTFSFAQNFQLSCRNLELPTLKKERLLRSADCMLEHFSKSVQTSDRKVEMAALFVALTCLRDCKEVLDEASDVPEEVRSQFEFLHPRLEQLCLDRADGEKGQLRMFG